MKNTIHNILFLIAGIAVITLIFYLIFVSGDKEKNIELFRGLGVWLLIAGGAGGLWLIIKLEIGIIEKFPLLFLIIYGIAFMCIWVFLDAYLLYIGIAIASIAFIAALVYFLYKYFNYK